MEPSRAEHLPGNDKVISPFAESEVAISRGKKGNGKLFLVIAVGLFLVVIGAVAAVFAMRYINDPYRTLENFPVSKYLDGYQALAGSKYKANFRVEADLGWKEGAGRLMLFSTSDDSRPIAVLVPAAVANGIYFTKGQTYTAEVEVKEGGLIYANSFQKN
jgi:hypothetical protein